MVIYPTSSSSLVLLLFFQDKGPLLIMFQVDIKKKGSFWLNLTLIPVYHTLPKYHNKLFFSGKCLSGKWWFFDSNCFVGVSFFLSQSEKLFRKMSNYTFFFYTTSRYFYRSKRDFTQGRRRRWRWVSSDIGRKYTYVT